MDQLNNGKQLEFNDTPLAEVVAEFNGANRVKMVVDDPGLASVPVGASLRSDNVEGFVRLLEASFNVKAEPKVGSVAKFRFGDKGGGSDMVITALQPHRLVRWRCVDHLSGEEWIGTEVLFELVAEPNRTVLRFSHLRWLEATDFLRACSVRWALYLVSLKNLVETGKGNPWPRDIRS